MITGRKTVVSVCCSVPGLQNIGENCVDALDVQINLKKKNTYHEMRIQTSHLQECQSHLKDLTVVLPLTRMGSTVLQATATTIHET